MNIYEGIKVLEIAEDVAGASAGLGCALRGALVIKLEPPQGNRLRHFSSYAAGESKLFQALNRGKQSLVLPPNEATGVLDKLVADQDVLIVSDTTKANAYNMSYERARMVKPDIIYVSLSAFGTRGPMQNVRGNELAIQAFSGAMMAERKTRQDGITPARITSTRFSEYGSGLAMAIGISAALFHHLRTGEGQLVETSLLHNVMMLQGGRCIQNEAADAATQSARETLLGGRAQGASLREILRPATVVINPFYRAYQTRDGAVFVGALTRGLRDKARSVLETRLMLRDGPDWNPKDPVLLAAAEAEQKIIEARVKQQTTSYWQARLERAGVPTGEVVFPEDMADTNHIRENGYLVEVVHETGGNMLQVAPPIRYELCPDQDRRPSPTLGRDTNTILARYQ